MQAQQAVRNSQAQGCWGFRRFHGLGYFRRERLIGRIVNECSDRLWRNRHRQAVHLVRVHCADIVFVTAYPNVIEVHNGRPLHITAEQRHTNHEACISDVPAGWLPRQRPLLHVSTFRGQNTESYVLRCCFVVAHEQRAPPTIAGGYSYPRCNYPQSFREGQEFRVLWRFFNS